MKFTSSKHHQQRSLDIVKIKAREVHSNRLQTWYEASNKKGYQMIQVSGGECTSDLWIFHLRFTVIFALASFVNFADFMSSPELQHYQCSSLNRVECFSHAAITASVRLRTQQRPPGDFAAPQSARHPHPSLNLSRVRNGWLKHQCQRKGGLFGARPQTRPVGHEADVQSFRFCCRWGEICRAFGKVKRNSGDPKLDRENIFFGPR